VVPHIPRLPGTAQQEIAVIELRAAANWAADGLRPGAVFEALTGWAFTAHHPDQRRFHPCVCCGRGSRLLLEQASALLTGASARSLARLIEPLDQEYLSRTAPDPLAAVTLPWWARRV
jgi:hypothetical protein